VNENSLTRFSSTSDSDRRLRAFHPIACWPLIAVLFSACSPKPPPPAPPKPAPYPVRSLSGFTFADASLKTTASRFDRAASGIYQSDWIKHPLARSPSSPQYRPNYEASWELLPTPDVGAEHYINLTLISTRHQPDRIESVDAKVRYFPTSGWGAVASYGINARLPQPVGVFGMRFVDIKRPRRQRWIHDFDLDVPVFGCKAEIKGGDRTYVFRVVTIEASGFEPITSINERVCAYLASPEALRDSALQELEAIEAKAPKDVESGKAWISTVDWTNVSSDNPPREMPPRPGASLPDELKAEALDALRKEIERQRTLIKDHYRALHASAQQAFPLYDCIEDSVQKETPATSGSQDVKQP